MKRSHRVGTGLVLPVLMLFGCNRNDSWEFSALVVSVDDEEICLNLTGDGPGYINNGCLDRADVVDLPEQVTVGECLLMNQQLHADLVYLERTDCETGSA